MLIEIVPSNTTVISISNENSDVLHIDVLVQAWTHSSKRETIFEKNKETKT